MRTFANGEEKQVFMNHSLVQKTVKPCKQRDAVNAFLLKQLRKADTLPVSQAGTKNTEES